MLMLMLFIFVAYVICLIGGLIYVLLELAADACDEFAVRHPVFCRRLTKTYIWFLCIIGGIPMLLGAYSLMPDFLGIFPPQTN